MALPITPANVADTYNQLRDSAVNLHSYMSELQSQLNAGSTSATFMIVVLSAAAGTLQLAQTISAMAPVGSTLGNALDSYVQQQSGQPTLDVHGELTASMAALATFTSTAIGEYPKDGSGHLLDRTFDANGNIVWSQIAASSVPNTRTAISNWLATVS